MAISEKCPQHCLKRVPKSWFLSSIQDELGSDSVTGGASVDVYRLIFRILFRTQTAVQISVWTATNKSGGFATKQSPEIGSGLEGRS